MIQHSQHLPSCMPPCAPSHHPQLVRTVGTPAGHRIGTPCPPTWHIECHGCRTATVPSPSRAITESRWRDPAQRIPLSQLRLARLRAAALPAAA